ncbi:LysR family transcriptional regulator [Salinispora arenicola]|uniref:LysR family transcriptional regulator n=1 Tax=Salinispora arenicola TaxID=168697 RepID=UPI0027DB61E6|nr:LysR family transcriptional regulator [Salinispora arenicola]
MGNISGAAQQLHASQSAVSMAIQRLEKQLDTKLFFRHRTKGVSLTPSGRVLLDPAKSLLAQAQEMLAHSREWQGETSGMLNVAVLRSVAPDLVPAVLSRVKEMCPGLEVTVHEGTMDDVLELLRTGTCELAVIPELPGQALSFTRLAKVLMAAVVHRSDPLASVGRATLRQLATRRLLVADLDVDHQIGLDNRTRLFADAGAPTPEVTLTSSNRHDGLASSGSARASPFYAGPKPASGYRQGLAWIDHRLPNARAHPGVGARPYPAWLSAAVRSYSFPCSMTLSGASTARWRTTG